jgi:hypothetical protein
MFWILYTRASNHSQLQVSTFEARVIDSKAHLQEIVRCSFKLKLDLDVIPSLSN